MLVLDYKLNIKTGTETSSEGFDVSKISLTDLDYSGVFIGDVIMRLDFGESTGVDFSDYYGNHPILYFTRELYRIAESLRSSIFEYYDYPDDGQVIWFHRNDSQLHIITNYAPGNLVVDFDQFKEKAEDLFLKAYRNFIDLHPTAIDSPAILDIKNSIARIEEKYTNI